MYSKVEMLLIDETRAYEPVFLCQPTMTRNPAPKRGRVETSLPHINVSQGNMFGCQKDPYFLSNRAAVWAQKQSRRDYHEEKSVYSHSLYCVGAYILEKSRNEF